MPLLGCSCDPHQQGLLGGTGAGLLPFSTVCVLGTRLWVLGL